MTFSGIKIILFARKVPSFFSSYNDRAYHNTREITMSRDKRPVESAYVMRVEGEFSILLLRPHIKFSLHFLYHKGREIA